MEIHCLMRKSNRLATAASILLWSALASFALRAAPATNLILMISDGCGLNSRAAAAFYMGSTNPAMACAALPVHCAVSTHPLSTGATPGSPANGAYDPAAAWKSDFSGLMKNCTDSAQRVATIQKAETLLPYADVQSLLAFEKTGPDGTREFDPLRDNLARRFIELSDERPFGPGLLLFLVPVGL